MPFNSFWLPSFSTTIMPKRLFTKRRLCLPGPQVSIVVFVFALFCSILKSYFYWYLCLFSVFLFLAFLSLFLVVSSPFVCVVRSPMAHLREGGVYRCTARRQHSAGPVRRLDRAGKPFELRLHACVSEFNVRSELRRGQIRQRAGHDASD